MNKAQEMVKIAHRALEEKKGGDILILDIAHVTIVADYFLISHGENSHQVQAMADEVEEQMAKAGYPCRHIEGYAAAKWILLDFGDLVVHIFSQEDRRFYDLERIWRSGITLGKTEIETW
ncbi:MAG: ribosome silencing factor [Lachnospiraceae bacterium]|nr:ribosome silencing factor [Lachnospiraceae bacterium]